jgi:glucuronate isomerase
MPSRALALQPHQATNLPLFADQRESAAFLRRCNPTVDITASAIDIFVHLQGVPSIDGHTHYDVPSIITGTHCPTPTHVFLGRPAKVLSQGEANFGFDHYIAQLMLQYNTPEEVVYGTKDRTPENEFERFDHLVRCMKLALGTDRYLWFTTSLETTFGLEANLMRASSAQLWQEISEKLASGRYSPQSMLVHAGVRLALTTDDPSSDLSLHSQSSVVKLLPTWRPDPVLMLRKGGRYDFLPWLRAVEARAQVTEVKTLDDLINLLRNRMAYFKAHGCVACDIGFPNFYPSTLNYSNADGLLRSALGGQSDRINKYDEQDWQGFMLRKLCELNAEFNFRQYMHQGPARDTNTARFGLYGPDTGSDGQGEQINRTGFRQLFDALFRERKLSPTLFFPLNPEDYQWVARNKTPFCGGGTGEIPNLLVGPPWWWNDNRAQNYAYIERTLAADGPAAVFPMVSDARMLATVHPRILAWRANLAVALARWGDTWGLGRAVLHEHATQIALTNAEKWLGLPST